MKKPFSQPSCVPALPKSTWIAAAITLVFTLTACSRPPAGESKPADGQSTGTSTTASTNRISVPESVRRNLGITFARVESRRVAQTLRMPGRFEVLPEARREYHAPLPGTVELLVKQYDRVSTGTPLYRLDSAQWRRVKQEMAQAVSDVRSSSASLSAAQVWHEHFHDGEGRDIRAVAASRVESLRDAVRASGERVANLEKLQGAIGMKTADMADARDRLATAKAELSQAEVDRANLDANYHSTESAHESAKLKLRVALGTVASYLGMSVDELTRPTGDGPDAPPYWQTVNVLEFRATAPGVVEKLALTNGGFAEEAGLVLSTADTERVRFRAVALQNDLGRLTDGMKATVVPPPGVSGDAPQPIPGVLHLGIEADPDERTVDVVVLPAEKAPWMRPGVTAYTEAVLDETEDPELAVPVVAVIQDELVRVVFRRNPDNPDEVMRVEADLGVSDGRWVVLNSGVREGDEVVLDGVYELKLTGSGKPAAGGHFHADGQFHAAAKH